MTNMNVNTTVTASHHPNYRDLSKRQTIRTLSSKTYKKDVNSEGQRELVVSVNISTGAKCNKIYQDFVVTVR